MTKDTNPNSDTKHSIQGHIEGNNEALAGRYTCNQCKKSVNQVYLVQRQWLCKKCY